MSDTTYIDYVTPAVNAEWLNEINDHVWHDTPVTGTTVHDASVIKNTPAGTIAATTVQMALNELDTEKATVSSVNEKVSSTTLAASSGSSLVGYIQSGSGTTTTTVQTKLREQVSVKDFGAIGDDLTDDTTAIQAAFDSGASHITLVQGKIYRATALTISNSNVTLEMPAGSGIRGTVATNKLITVSGDNCALVGTGTIFGQATFDGANVQPTYALVWVTGNNLYCSGITIDTVPKEALMFENSTGHRVEGCRFIGRYPYASYDENTTTNHCAIMSNIPMIATNAKPALVITGNYFESFIQGCLMANYDSAGNNTGVEIVGNTFKNCWDHGVYMSRGKGHNITGNLFLSCRRPIVSDGIGSVVSGNVLYSEETGVLNAEQTISVRESSNSVISNNTIYGVDASILVDNIETTSCVGNIITNNNIFSTGKNYVTAGIRVGVGAQVCTDNVVSGNTVQSSSLGPANSLVDINILTGYFGTNNTVKNNMLIRGDAGPVISVNRHSYAEISGNTVKISGSTGVATTVKAINITACAYPIVSENRLLYTSGGTNVTLNGVAVDAGCTMPKITNTTFIATATFVSFVPLSLAVAADVRKTVFDPISPLSGTFTWASGVASTVVASTNINSSSKIVVSPQNVGAAAIVRDLGYYITPAAGSFTIATAGGASTASASNWLYEIL